MGKLAKLIPYEAYDDEIEKLLKLLRELDIPIPADASIANEAVQAFKFLYFATFAEEREAELTIDDARIHVGLGDLATKINKARAKVGEEAIRAHLENMVKGAVRMNEASCVLDDAANKTCELYVGCLAMGRKWPVALDDPINSSGGLNPDVIIERGGQHWAVAVKAIHSRSSQTLFDRIADAALQIERSGKPGIPFINLKNRIRPSELMPAAGVHATLQEANSALSTAMEAIVRRLRDEIVDDDWRNTFEGKLARPVVAFMSQAVTAFRNWDAKEVFVPVRQMMALTVPPLPVGDINLSGLDLDAWHLICELNKELQDSP